MSYTVLARRYRSGTFDEVIGQEHVAQTLKKAIASNRVAHAYLFCGTRGTGKTSMARILAKALNCYSTDKPTTEPCGKCDSCLAIARGDDMDVIELDAASNRSIDEVRRIIENSRYRPARSRFKVYIIDEVHGLTKDAFNALLKVLEEPAEHVKFILATTEPEKILPTILSRCQRYDFRNIPSREIADHLKQICKQEKIKADDDALLLIAKAGAGSMRDALSLLDRMLSVGEKQLTVEMIEQLLGMPRAQVIFDLAGAIGGGDVKNALQIASNLINGGLSSESLVAALVDHLRNLLILRTCGPDTDLVELPGFTMTDLMTQAEQFDAAALSQDIAILETLRRNLRTSQAGRALLDATLVRLSLAEQFTSVSAMLNGSAAPATSSAPALKKNGSALIAPQAARGFANQAPRPVETSTRETAASAKPQATSSASNAAPAAPEDADDDLPAPGKVWSNDGPSLAELVKQQQKLATASQAPATADSNVEPVNPTDFTAVMARLRSAIHAQNPGIDGFLVQGQLVHISDDGTATIRYPASSQTAVAMLDRNGKRQLIESELSAVLNRPVILKFELAPELADSAGPVAPPPRPAMTASPARSAPPTGIRITAELREQLRNEEPLVKQLMDELGAEIVKVE